MSLRDLVEVELADGHLQNLRISSRWRDQGSVADLENALTSAIRAALPTPDPIPSPTLAARAGARKDLSLEQLEHYMELHQQWRDGMRALKADIAAGKYRANQPDEVTDEAQRVAVDLGGGRFNGVHFNPAWIETASLQAISDALHEVFDGLDLNAGSERDEALARVRELDRAATEYVN